VVEMFATYNIKEVGDDWGATIVAGV
jgi:hypothetical protein